MNIRARNAFSYLVLSLLGLLLYAGLAFAQQTGTSNLPINQYGIQTDNPYVVNRFIWNGQLVDEIIVPGRPTPPVGFKGEAASIPEPNPAAGINSLSNVPALEWCFGCSATSAAMMFGYYDRTGWPNMYTGPTSGGVFPLTNASWPHVTINGEDRAQCPLSATRNGLDGRTIKGHVDDYWVRVDDPGPDPFIGQWTEHTKGDCTGDFMGTNQSLVSNSDGSTTFYNYTNGARLVDYTGSEPGRRDGCHGMKLFVESRGYQVSTNGNFSQYIYGYNGNTQGFTFAEYKTEIDAGRPVLIQLQGHTMLGFGYDDSGSVVYIHDTWDNSDHTMTWGGYYGGMRHYAVTVVQLVAAPPATLTITASAGTGGSISPSGAITVNYGANQVFTITPSTGYHVAAVLVDSASVGAVTSYTFSNVTTDHTISASFAKNKAIPYMQLLLN